jgi:hypothetical protein
MKEGIRIQEIVVGADLVPAPTTISDNVLYFKTLHNLSLENVLIKSCYKNLTKLKFILYNKNRIKIETVSVM